MIGLYQLEKQINDFLNHVTYPVTKEMFSDFQRWGILAQEYISSLDASVIKRLNSNFQKYNVMCIRVQGIIAIRERMYLIGQISKEDHKLYDEIIKYLDDTLHQIITKLANTLL